MKEIIFVVTFVSFLIILAFLSNYRWFTFEMSGWRVFLEIWLLSTIMLMFLSWLGAYEDKNDKEMGISAGIPVEGGKIEIVGGTGGAGLGDNYDVTYDPQTFGGGGGEIDAHAKVQSPPEIIEVGGSSYKLIKTEVIKVNGHNYELIK